jgi:uncharacterized membrane protein YfcA
MRTNNDSDVPDTSENQEHIAIGLPPIETERTLFILDRRFLFLIFLVATSMLGYWFSGVDQQIQHNITSTFVTLFKSEYFWLAVGIGLAAQIIDGALGMAYGVTSNSFLLSIGASPAAASGAVHVAEIFTTAFSGISHIRFKNVDKQLFRKIVIPGVFGGVVGVIFLTSIDGKLIKPFVTAYLLIMGIIILRKAFKVEKEISSHELKHVGKLAVSGGFLDAVGGGGWGPIVTSSLIGQGNNPRKTIGTVNTAEFFVALATGTGFLLLGGIDHWVLIAGLAFGGLFAAPFAAFLTSRFPVRFLLISVGLLISGLSGFNLYKILA